MNFSETIGYRCAVNSANREGSQQRYETVVDNARLHDVRVDVDGIEPLINAHHGIGPLTERVRATSSLFLGFNVTVADGVIPNSIG